jgi:putative peptidoglycan lipid II flippase
MKAAIVALLVNAVFSVILMFPLKHGGLALATSIATSVNVVMLSVILKKRIGVFLNREFYRSVFKMFLSSLAMWVVIIIIGIIFPWRDKGPLNERILYLMLCIFAGSATYFIAAGLAKCKEMMMITDMLKRKIRSAKVQ